jgi:alpha,alpha-trehalase
VQKLIITPEKWLADRIEIAKQEYETVWQSETTYNHFVPAYQLNRYGNTDVGYAQDSEQESGWDMTSRFYNRCNQFLPIDLNTFLYKYEQDFARVAQSLGNARSRDRWSKLAHERLDRINSLMWNSKQGFFVDYDFVHKVQSEFMSLAGFVPLWAGLATYEQAKKAKEKLPLFETPFGLTITDKASLPPESLKLTELPEPYRITVEEAFVPKQWDYPNIWPPLEYLTVIGLLRYGFTTDAKRIMEKSLAASVRAFEKYHGLLEKMDGLTGDMPRSYWYPTQLGFGWTNAICYRYTKLLNAIKQDTLYDTTEQTFPKTLQIVH